MLFSRCSASNGGGLVPSCKLQTFHNMVLAAGKTVPTGFDCVCFFYCAFRVAAQNSNTNTKNSSVRYARLLACRSVDVVSFFSYRYDSFINTTNALHATCLHKQRSSTTNPLPPRFHHVRRHSIQTDNMALAMFRRCLNPYPQGQLALLREHVQSTNAPFSLAQQPRSTASHFQRPALCCPCIPNLHTLRPDRT